MGPDRGQAQLQVRKVKKPHSILKTKKSNYKLKNKKSKVQCFNVYVQDNKAQFLVTIENEMKQLHIKNEARAQFHDKNKKVPAPKKKKKKKKNPPPKKKKKKKKKK